MCHGGRGRHIQGGSVVAPAALDAPIAGAAATVIGQGRDADEFADRPVCEHPESGSDASRRAEVAGQCQARIGGVDRGRDR